MKEYWLAIAKNKNLVHSALLFRNYEKSFICYDEIVLNDKNDKGAVGVRPYRQIAYQTVSEWKNSCQHHYVLGITKEVFDDFIELGYKALEKHFAEYLI